MPPAHVLPERLDAVLAVIYLVFNEGWGGGRVDLAAEAIRLGRVLATLMPDESEVLGLLALMLLNDSRRDARLRDGRARPARRSGSLALERGADRRRPLAARARDSRCAGAGPTSCRRRSPTSTSREPRDWEQIALLYGALGRLTGSPVVELNRAIAIGEIAGPDAALALLDALALDDYRYFHSTRADLLRRLGRNDEAAPPTHGRSS